MARSIWTGTISFGLVSIPVRMFTATESKELKFHFLHKDDLVPIGYDKVRKDTGEHVDPDEIVRGFEIEKGQYVPITDEDLDRVDVELTRSIDICDFVDLDEIDPIYFRKGYYLLPQQGAEKPYRLLEQALEDTGKVAIAKVVIRKKQHLACVRTYEGALLLETMYFDDAFEPSKYDDTYRKELLELIQAKAKGMDLPEPQEEEAPVIDLMAALRESVEQTKRERRTPTKKP